MSNELDRNPGAARQGGVRAAGQTVTVINNPWRAVVDTWAFSARI
jgi:hypothetical protein